jgi:general secretion pathway protein A
MYERHFGFTAKPFALTPDPAFLYLSREHAMALTMLEYGLECHAAFSLLTGDIGSGKTTLLRRLLRQLGDQVAVGLISNTHARFRSIHGWALSALSIVPSGDSDIAIYEALVDSFVREYAKGRRTLLILDEAQNLSVEVLEELRLLSNVNSEKDLILQILLVGQPELRTKLARPELRQFAQRVSVDFHLKPLDRQETHAYIRHRLNVAGGDSALFSPDAIELMHARTTGVPRLLNQLGDFALVYAYAEGRTTVDANLIAQVVRDRSAGQSLHTVSAADPAVSAGIANSGAA